MSPRKRKPEMLGPSVPSYIVTFSDMVTLLLTFFVLLLSMAEDNDPGKLKAGIESFKQSISNFGLRGILYSHDTLQTFDDERVYHSIEEEDENQLTPANAAEEKLRRLFSKINDKMNARPSQIRGKMSDLITTNIKFSKDSATLNKDALRYLSEMCSELKLSMENQNVNMYVVGLGYDMSGQDGWIIAAKRGKAVAGYLKKQLSSNFSIYSWGTAKQDEWVTSTGANGINTQVLIAIIE